MLSLQNAKWSRNGVLAVRCIVILLLCGVLLMMSSISTTRVSAQGQSAAIGKFRRNGRPIPNQYIVVLNDDIPGSEVASKAAEMAGVSGGRIGYIYRYALSGFSIRTSEAEAIALSLDPRIEFVEEDGEVFAGTTQLNPPSWGLDRIDQASLPVNHAYTYPQSGTGVNVYTIDTGIRFSHADFGGRAFFGTDLVGDGQNGNDCNGHGTHVSGIVGGSQYGVAKNVRLYSVRIFPCQGGTDFSTATAAVDWVTNNHVKPAVANMSIQGPGNTAFDKAVRRSIAAGVMYAGAAGNFNDDASLYSPARIAQAITVGAAGDHFAPYISDNRWLNPFVSTEGSNFGSVLDLFAPGAGIVSAWYTSNTDFQTLTGTSQATPHVAGAAAMYLQTDPTGCQSTVSEIITNNATAGVVLNPGTGSPNKLLFVPLLWPTPTYYSLSLNGTNAYADVPNAGLGVSLDITGPLTLEAWIRLNNNTTRQAIVEKYKPSAGAGTNDGGYGLRVLPSGKVRFFTFKNAVEYSSITGNTVLTTGTWYHVAGVYNGGQLKIYIQGMSDATPVSVTYAPQAGTSNLKIGVSSEGTYFLNGLIDEVRVTARAIYSANFTPQQKLTGVVDTKGLWRFDRQNAKDCADIHNGALVGGATFSTTVP